MIIGYGALEILAAFRRLSPAERQLVRLPIAFLEVEAEVERAVTPPVTPATALRAREAAGVPALPDPLGAMHVSRVALIGLTERLCRLAARDHPELAPAAAGARAWIVDLAHAEMPGRALDRAEVRLLGAIAGHALRAFLRPAARALAADLDDAAWERPVCPVCGGAPDFAALTASAPGRRLLCARCDAEWTWTGGACPFCRTAAPDCLGCHAVGAGPYRVYGCAACRTYLKAVDLRRRGPACLPVERALTEVLDEAALELGYQSPPLRFPPLAAAW